MSVQRVLQIGFCGLLIATSLFGGSKPVAVSPGSATGALIGDACPTFSWGGVPEAKSYELVVYRVEEESEEAEPELRENLSGSASSWTPSLGRCLERGGEYAWSVRAVGRKGTSDWSPPSLFQVVLGPGEVEFEEAVQIVQRYLARRVESAAGSAEGAPRPNRPRGEPLTSGLIAPPLLEVDGGVVAISFSGDGSTLTGINVDDADADPANERNASVILNGTTLEVTDAGGTLMADLTSLKDGTGTDDQLLTFVADDLSMEGGNSVDLSSLKDGTGTDNQTLTFVADILSIEDGNGVDLSSLKDGTGTDNQLLTFVAGELTIEGGNSVDLNNLSTPAGAVMFFNLASCPSGWTALTAAEGRYLVGLASGGTLGSSVGSALADLENRSTGEHTHPINIYGSGADTARRIIKGISSNATVELLQPSDVLVPTGSIAGTNAPFLQLLVCQKN